jgi:hypothetical protein
MDNQPTDQMNEEASNNVWYLICIFIVIVLAGWYLYGRNAPTVNTESAATEQTQVTPLSSGNTTADITNDLNQTPDSSAALDQSAAASAQSVQGF